MSRWETVINAVVDNGIILERCNTSQDPPVCGVYIHSQKRIILFPESSHYDLKFYTLLHELTHFYLAHAVFKFNAASERGSDIELYTAIQEQMCCQTIPTVANLLGIYLEKHEKLHNDYLLDKYTKILDKRFRKYND